MKTLLTLIVFAISLSLSAQEKKTYKDYTPCTECFEQWKVSEGKSTSSPDINLNLPKVNNRTRKPFNETYIGSEMGSTIRIIVGGVLAVGTMIILNKATHPTIQ